MHYKQYTKYIEFVNVMMTCYKSHHAVDRNRIRNEFREESILKCDTTAFLGQGYTFIVLYIINNFSNKRKKSQQNGREIYTVRSLRLRVYERKKTVKR